MKIFKYSNIGNREENQDYLASVKLGQDRNLFLVADGMGGYDCGDIASKVVGDSYIWALSRNLSVEEATIQASENLNKEKHNLGIAKMGSTIAAVLLEGRLATIFWAGDSRVYFEIMNNSIKHKTILSSTNFVKRENSPLKKENAMAILLPVL